MKNRKFWIVCGLLLVALLIGACANGNNQGSEVEEQIANTPTTEAPTEEVQMPTQETLPTETPKPQIVHQDFPQQPDYLISQFIRDCNTGKWVVQGELIQISYACDSWAYGAVERPYNEEHLVFYPEVDILSMQFGQDETWFYIRFEVFENASAEKIEGVFGVELDLNFDLRGDVLILANNPAPGDWTVEGVTVWKDANMDNGAKRPLVADYTPDMTFGDGYEVLVFSAGEGDDPDAAWARLAPDDANSIEIAFKRSVIDFNNLFEWWGWASKDPIMAEKFDLNDHFNDTEVYGVDNSCGWLYGSDPDLSIPNLCYIAPTPTPVFVCPGAPAEGCGNSWNSYFDDETCQCITCGRNEWYNPRLDRCEVLN